MHIVEKALTRFLIKLVFCVLLILSLLFLGFLPTFWILAGLFVLVLILTKGIKFQKFHAILTKLEREYETGFAGKETFIVLLGFIFFFLIVWLLQYFIAFPVEQIAIIGLIPLTFGNNLVKPLQTWLRNHLHFISHKMSIEGFVIATLINILAYYLLLPYNIVVFIYLALIASLFDMIPYIDSNYTIPIFTSLAFLLFFI
ncbi:MAG: hypothetical protein PHH82_03035 [Candidatus ainarchaeum sp.]|nr:hypothetical protein [Candidatus ainarchaeum sp.]